MTDLAGRVAALEWYHTMDLPGGVVTPGFFDIRPVLSRYGLPSRMEGRRVLDVGTFDGFFAFEFERRGAEVVGLDVPGVESLDWPAPLKAKGTTRFQPRHANFDLAREAYGSAVRREFVSVYDVTPENVGTFDVVFVGSVLIHLRDPVGALMALRGVCKQGGEIRIVEEFDARLDLVARVLGRRRVALARLQALSPHLTWWVPNTNGWQHMLEAAGYTGVQRGERFTIPFRVGKGGVPHVVLWATNP
ncbi:MAG TPA: methyltransferase domain-containing protein [Acidimicrobiales bacterium]|nr:methyltransferase domain-containing protein [Acidimicrobiales bacterium]